MGDEFFQIMISCPHSTLTDLKGQSALYCTDLDTSFSHFVKSLPQPEIKLHLEIRFIFRNVLFFPSCNFS